MHYSWHPVCVCALRAHLAGIILQSHRRTSYFTRETSWELDMSVRVSENIGTLMGGKTAFFKESDRGSNETRFDAQHGRFGAQIRTLKYKYCYLWTQRTDSEVWYQSAQSGKPWKSIGNSSDNNRLPLTAFTAGNLTFHSRKIARCLFAKAEKYDLKMAKTTPVWLISPGVRN